MHLLCTSLKYITFAGELCNMDFVVIVKKWASATQYRYWYQRKGRFYDTMAKIIGVICSKVFFCHPLLCIPTKKTTFAGELHSVSVVTLLKECNSTSQNGIKERVVSLIHCLE